jgi:hypothetical protein
MVVLLGGGGVETAGLVVDIELVQLIVGYFGVAVGYKEKRVRNGRR